MNNSLKIDIYVSYFFSALSLAFLILALLRDGTCLQYGNVLGLLVDGFREVLEFIVSPVAIFLEEFASLFRLPKPHPDWTLVLAISLVPHLRALSIDAAQSKQRRKVGLISFFCSVIFASVSSFLVGVFFIAGDKVLAASMIVVVVFLLEFMRNLIFSMHLRNENESLVENFIYRQKVYTVGYTATALVALLTSLYLSIPSGIYNLGIFVSILFLFFALYLIIVENYYRHIARDGQVQSNFWESTRVITAILLVTGVAGSISALVIDDGTLTGIVSKLTCQ